MCLIAYFMVLAIRFHNTHKNTILGFDDSHTLHNLPGMLVTAITLPFNCLLLSQKVWCEPGHEGDH